MSIFEKLFGQKNDDGETSDFKALIEGSMEGLRLLTEAHQDTWLALTLDYLQVALRGLGTPTGE